MIRIGVQDTGRGIDQEKQHKLFQEFGRVEDTAASAVEGTGLGLLISKRIVENMNGTIGAESDAKSGSLFWIEIPFIPTTPTEQPPNTSRPSSPKITSIEQSPHVLISDDNEMNRIVITSSLEMLGCTTKSAVDGNDAFRLFEQEDFDLILMDNYMPVASRPEAAKRIRATAAPKCSVPIVGLTASEDPTEKKVTLGSRMDIVYVKPLIQAVLRSILREYVKSASPF